MGMSTGSGGRKGALNEINVTPLVDVMLVLLVVFMVTTPIIVQDMQRNVDIDLPATNAEPVDPHKIQTILVLDAGLKVSIDRGEGPSELVSCAGMGEYAECLAPLEAMLKANPVIKDLQSSGGRLFLMADRKLPYGFVVDVMARVKSAGITNLGMVTNPPEGAAKAGQPG